MGTLITTKNKTEIKKMYENININDRVKVKNEIGNILQLCLIIYKKIDERSLQSCLIIWRECEEQIPNLIKNYISGEANKEEIKDIEKIKVSWENIYECKIKDKIDFLIQAEKYNGLGYRIKGININSPYVWSGSQYYTVGKYEKDGKYNGRLVDRQTGVAVLLKAYERIIGEG